MAGPPHSILIARQAARFFVIFDGLRPAELSVALLAGVALYHPARSWVGFQLDPARCRVAVLALESFAIPAIVTRQPFGDNTLVLHYLDRDVEHLTHIHVITISGRLFWLQAIDSFRLILSALYYF